MAKCDICGKKIQTTFLKKMLGTTIKDVKGKKKYVCFECQKKFHSKEQQLENMK